MPFLIHINQAAELKKKKTLKIRETLLSSVCKRCSTVEKKENCVSPAPPVQTKRMTDAAFGRSEANIQPTHKCKCSSVSCSQAEYVVVTCCKTVPLLAEAQSWCNWLQVAKIRMQTAKINKIKSS